LSPPSSLHALVSAVWKKIWTSEGVSCFTSPHKHTHCSLCSALLGTVPRWASIREREKGRKEGRKDAPKSPRVTEDSSSSSSSSSSSQHLWLFIYSSTKLSLKPERSGVG
jgi:hypothetical protein